MVKRVEVWECSYEVSINITNSLTGKWKIVTRNGRTHLYIQRAWPFSWGPFTTWAHESDVVIYYIEEYVNDCKR